MGSDGTMTNGLQTPEPEVKRRKRSSPRSLAKKNYRDLDDPYTSVAIEDPEGNVVFEEEKPSSLAESSDDDGEYSNPSSATITA